MKRNGLYIVTFLISLLFWQWAYFVFKGHYSGLSEAHKEVAVLKKEVTRAHVRSEVVQWQFELFRQQVAKVLPSIVKEYEGEPQKLARGLASVVMKPNQEYLTLAQYDASVERVKDLFAQRKFKEVIIKANQLLEMNIVSPSILSLYFILAESYYQTHELDQCFATARRMVELFPEEEKTGYVLLRVGMFLQEKNRVEEAKNMFALVGQAFSGYADLKDKSERFLSSVVSGSEQ